jgi:hypothetical protein
LRYKIIILSAVVLTASAVSFGVASVPASATGFKNVVLCDLEASPLCMSGYDGNGGAVKGEPINPGAAQDVNVTVLTNCGGTVTNTCPFTEGLGLNKLFNGASIVSITNRANGMTYRSDSQALKVVEVSGGGNGQVWVQVGDMTGSNPGAFLVNVYASDKLGVAEIACTTGSGGQLFLEQQNSASEPACQWQEFAN